MSETQEAPQDTASEPVEPVEPEAEPEATDAGYQAEGLAEQPVAQTEPEAEAEAEPQVGEAEIEKQGKQLHTAARNYSKRVVEILGAELGPEGGWIPCELCGQPFPGIRLNRAPEGETIERLRVVIGLPSMENYEPTKYARECDSCVGLGIVKTGSKVPMHATVQCIDCKGKGWVAIGDELRGEQPVAPDGAQPVTSAAEQAPPAAMPPAALDALRSMVASAELAQAGG